MEELIKKRQALFEELEILYEVLFELETELEELDTIIDSDNVVPLGRL